MIKRKEKSKIEFLSADGVRVLEGIILILGEKDE